MSQSIDLIEYPWITEKGTLLQKDRKYVFRVRPQATKTEIKKIIENMFHVHVVKINTSLVRGKQKRVRVHPGYTASWKKAVVTLKEGEKIDYTK